MIDNTFIVGDVELWPCHKCGKPGARNLGSQGYCASHYAETTSRFEQAAIPVWEVAQEHFDDADAGPSNAEDTDYRASLDAMVVASEPRFKLNVTPIGDVPITATRFLVRGLIPRDEVTILSARGGFGKGVVAADIVAAGSIGGMMGNGETVRGFSSVIACGVGEDGPHEWRRRLAVVRHDPTRIFIVDTATAEAGAVSAIGLRHLLMLVTETSRLGADLLVIDSLSAFVGDLDINRREVREHVVGPLADAARRFGVSVLVIHHDNKAKVDARDKSSGHHSILDASRAAWSISMLPDDPERSRVLMEAKFNLGVASPPMKFRIDSVPLLGDDGRPVVDDDGRAVTAPVVLWLGTVTHREAEAASRGERRCDDEAEAIKAVEELLAGGPLPTKDVKEHLSGLGFGPRIVDRVTGNSAGWRRKRTGFAAAGVWWLGPRDMSEADFVAAVEAKGASL